MNTLCKILLATLASLGATGGAHALQNARTDAATPAANATVRVGGCTGTLVAPTVVLSSGHCFVNRPRSAADPGFAHACGDWQRPDRWYRLGAAVAVAVGADSAAPLFRTSARSYSLPGCVDIILLRLDRAVPASAAVPAAVLTDPALRPGAGARLRVAGWGSSGLEDLWVRDADTTDRPWGLIGHAHRVEGMTESGGFLYAATEAGGLWRRAADLANRPWRRIGAAPGVVSLAAADGLLFAATSGGRLLVREAGAGDVPWRDTGGASNVTGMAAVDGRLFAATSRNALWSRPAIEGPVSWSHVGHANGIVGLAASDGRLYGATSGDVLWVREPRLIDTPWRRVGGALDVRALAADATRLYAAQREPESGAPLNARRFRQSASAAFAAFACGDGTALERRVQRCVDPAGSARVRGGDSGGPLYWRRDDGTSVVVGVARQDAGDVANYVGTAFVNSDDGRLGSGDVGPWLERMISVR